MSQSIRYTVNPYDLPKVKHQHRDGVFGRFEDVVGRRIKELQAENHPSSIEKIRFFQYLIDTVDHSAFGAFQKQFLAGDQLPTNVDLPKYIDPIIWFESKINVAIRLNLNHGTPKRILDIGTGPGHFAVVAAFYGHDVVGTDLPARTLGRGPEEHFYDAICDIYKVKRVPKMISPFERIDDVDSGYEVITALLAAFNVNEDKSPWSEREWDFFFHSIKEDVAGPSAEMFFSLADNKLTVDAWNYVKSKSDWFNDRSKQVHWKSLDWV